MTPAEAVMVKVRRLTSRFGSVGQRRAVVVVTSLLLCVAVVLVAREEDAKRASALASERVVSIQSAVARSTDSNGMNATIAQPSFFEKFMQRLLDLNFNSTKKQEEGKDCDDGIEECIPAAAIRISAWQVAKNLAGDWEARTHGRHPFQFCADFSDLTAKELRECIRHLMKPLELAKTEPIAHNGTSASLTLALLTNTTFNVSEESGWDACYEAFEDVIDKRRCMTFIDNKLAGDVAFACSKKDTDEQLHKCVTVMAARDNIQKLIMRQEFVPAKSQAKANEEEARKAALQAMRDEENKTDIALQSMSPELEKMYKRTMAMSAESNIKISNMEEAIEATLVGHWDRLGATPTFGELPGKSEHEYIAEKSKPPKNSAVAVVAGPAVNPVAAATAEMRSIIRRKYSGPGDASRALHLMKTPAVTPKMQKAAKVMARVAAADSAHTETLLEVGGGMQGAETMSARVQGLENLEKLAMRGNMADLDAVMAGQAAVPQHVVTEDQDAIEQMQVAEIAQAFKKDSGESASKLASLASSNDDDSASTSKDDDSDFDSLLNNFDSKIHSVDTADVDRLDVWGGAHGFAEAAAGREEAAAIAHEFRQDSKLAKHLDSVLGTSGAVNDGASLATAASEHLPPPPESFHDAASTRQSASGATSRSSVDINLLQDGQLAKRPAVSVATKIKLLKALEQQVNAAEQAVAAVNLKVAVRAGKRVRKRGMPPSLVTQVNVKAKSDSVAVKTDGLNMVPPEIAPRKGSESSQDPNLLAKETGKEESEEGVAQHMARPTKLQAANVVREIKRRKDAKYSQTERVEEANEQAHANMQAATAALAGATATKPAPLEQEPASDAVKARAAAAAQIASATAATAPATTATVPVVDTAHPFYNPDFSKSKAEANSRKSASIPFVHAKSSEEQKKWAAVMAMAKAQEEERAADVPEDEGTRQAPTASPRQQKSIKEAMQTAATAKATAKEAAKEAAKRQELARGIPDAARSSLATVHRVKPAHKTAFVGQEAVIESDLKRLEQNAEAEPVATSQERAEQRAEVREAKNLLEEAGALLQKGMGDGQSRSVKSTTVPAVPVHTALGRVQSSKTAQMPKLLPSVTRDIAPQQRSVGNKAARLRQPTGTGKATGGDDKSKATHKQAGVRHAGGQSEVSPVQSAPADKTLTKESYFDQAQQLQAHIQKNNAAEEANIDNLIKGSVGVDSVGSAPVHTPPVIALSKEADSGNLDDLVNMLKQGPAQTDVQAALDEAETEHISFDNTEARRHLAKEKEEKEIENMTDKKPAHIKIASVIAEAKEIKEMTAREDVLIKKAPGGDAIDRLKTLDAKIHAARQGIKEHEAKEKMYKKQAAEAQKNMQKLESDNSDMFGLISALQSAGSAGGALGSMIAQGLDEAQKPTAKVGDVVGKVDKILVVPERPLAHGHLGHRSR